MKKVIQYDGSKYRIVSLLPFTRWTWHWYLFHRTVSLTDETYVYTQADEYSNRVISEFDTLEEATDALLSLEPKDNKWVTITK